MLRSERYATVRTSFLNGGTGESIRNVTRDEFERLHRRFSFGDVPTSGAGASGDGLVNFQWKIYTQLPDYSPSLYMRLLPYQIRKAIAREKAAQ